MKINMVDNLRDLEYKEKPIIAPVNTIPADNG
jgi:hypothetical protein